MLTFIAMFIGVYIIIGIGYLIENIRLTIKELRK
jgi:hypothetical protein